MTLDAECDKISALTGGNTYQFDAFGITIASTATTANTYLYQYRTSELRCLLSHHVRLRWI